MSKIILHLYTDLTIIVLSIFVAILLAKTGALGVLLNALPIPVAVGLFLISVVARQI